MGQAAFCLRKFLYCQTRIDFSGIFRLVLQSDALSPTSMSSAFELDRGINEEMA
jgi:hypothetical protein